MVVSALAKVTDALLEVARLAEAGDATAAREAVRALHRRHEEMAALVRATERRADLLSAIDALFGELEGIVRALAVVEEVSPRSSDAIVAFGELASSRIVAAALEDAGLPARWLDARGVLVTDGQHGAAVPDRDGDGRAAALARAAAPRGGPRAGRRAASWAPPPPGSPPRSGAGAPTSRPRSSAPASRPTRSRSGPTSTAC